MKINLKAIDMAYRFGGISAVCEYINEYGNNVDVINYCANKYFNLEVISINDFNYLKSKNSKFESLNLTLGSMLYSPHVPSSFYIRLSNSTDSIVLNVSYKMNDDVKEILHSNDSIPLQILKRHLESVFEFCNKNGINIKDNLKYVTFNVTDYFRYDDVIIRLSINEFNSSDNLNIKVPKYQ